MESLLELLAEGNLCPPAFGAELRAFSRRRTTSAYSILPTPRPLTSTLVCQLTLRSGAVHVASPTRWPSACLRRLATSLAIARRSSGEVVVRKKDVSWSSVADRVDRFDEPMSVSRGGCRAEGESQTPVKIPMSQQKGVYSKHVSRAAQR